jgi:hypothetical protein
MFQIPGNFEESNILATPVAKLQRVGHVVVQTNRKLKEPAIGFSARRLSSQFARMDLQSP